MDGSHPLRRRRFLTASGITIGSLLLAGCVDEDDDDDMDDDVDDDDDMDDDDDDMDDDDDENGA